MRPIAAIGDAPERRGMGGVPGMGHCPRFADSEFIVNFVIRVFGYGASRESSARADREYPPSSEGPICSGFLTEKPQIQ